MITLTLTPHIFSLVISIKPTKQTVRCGHAKLPTFSVMDCGINKTDAMNLIVLLLTKVSAQIMNIRALISIRR
jgi:hypothetical protein